MMFGVPLFYIGILLVIIGSIGAAIILYDTTRNSDSFVLDDQYTKSISVKVKGSGIGFYTISLSNYQNDILAKVVDSHGNSLDIRKITNKVIVDYFRFNHDDQITLELTNLADKPVQVSGTIGDTRVKEVTIPAIMMFTGALILVFEGYKKLKNYITEHPDENRS